MSMKRYPLIAGLLLPALLMCGPTNVRSQETVTGTYPTAVFPFAERGSGVKGYGRSVADILFARLSLRPEIILVERGEIEKLLSEVELGLSGIIDVSKAADIGHLTGARILLTGSVFEMDGAVYVVAKIIGTETSRVLGESVTGEAGDLASLVETLAGTIGDTIIRDSSKLVAHERSTGDRIAALKETLGSAARPSVSVQVKERHVGQATVDPAARTEIELFLTETGFTVLDADKGAAGGVDIVIEGEGFSEFALRKGNLVSVKARLEIRALDRDGQVIAVDRQTAIVVDLTEQIAGKNALQRAAAGVAERLLPALANRE